MAPYLNQRSGGMIGSLDHLIYEAANDAINDRARAVEAARHRPRRGGMSYIVRMKQVLPVVEYWRDRIEDHPLQTWLVTPEENVRPEQKLWFALYFTNFIMYFRELNLYHVSYGDDRKLDRQRGAISAHADEDMTHSQLFMQDLRTLGWDEMLGWRPSELYYWLFLSEVNESLRRRVTQITKLVIEAEDPVVRFAVVESIEACGNALFRHTDRLARKYTAATGKELIYWGAFHLARESGHVVDDDAFEDVELTEEQREAARRRAIRIFELIDEQNSDMLRLAQETISQGGFDYRRAIHAAPARWLPTIPGPEVFDFNFWPDTDAHPSQLVIQQAWRRCRAALRDSEYMRFFTADTLEEGKAKLRFAVLYSATDACGTPTVYKYMLPYPIPVNARERAINRLSKRFGRRAAMLLVDWQSLGLDECLDWPVSRTLEFIYLDRATDSHRDTRAIITHHIDVTLDPVLRYWTIATLEGLTETYATATGHLAEWVARETGVDLPYMTLRLRPDAVVLEDDPEADDIQFWRLEVSEETARQGIALVTGIYEQILARLDAMVESWHAKDYPEVLQVLEEPRQ